MPGNCATTTVRSSGPKPPVKDGRAVSTDARPVEEKVTKARCALRFSKSHRVPTGRVNRQSNWKCGREQDCPHSNRQRSSLGQNSDSVYQRYQPAKENDR